MSQRTLCASFSPNTHITGHTSYTIDDCPNTSQLRDLVILTSFFYYGAALSYLTAGANGIASSYKQNLYLTDPYERIDQNGDECVQDITADIEAYGGALSPGSSPSWGAGATRQPITVARGWRANTLTFCSLRGLHNKVQFLCTIPFAMGVVHQPSY